jgi:hypothetical protein
VRGTRWNHQSMTRSTLAENLSDASVDPDTIGQSSWKMLHNLPATSQNRDGQTCRTIQMSRSLSRMPRIRDSERKLTAHSPILSPATRSETMSVSAAGTPADPFPIQEKPTTHGQHKNPPMPRNLRLIAPRLASIDPARLKERTPDLKSQLS